MIFPVRFLENYADPSRLGIETPFLCTMRDGTRWACATDGHIVVAVESSKRPDIADTSGSPTNVADILDGKGDVVILPDLDDLKLFATDDSEEVIPVEGGAGPFMSQNVDYDSENVPIGGKIFSAWLVYAALAWVGPEAVARLNAPTTTLLLTTPARRAAIIGMKDHCIPGKLEFCVPSFGIAVLLPWCVAKPNKEDKSNV